MADITIRQIDDVFVRLEADDGILAQLSDAFTFKHPGYKFSPAYKRGAWDGNIRIFKWVTRKIYVGLIPRVIEFAKENNYSFQLVAKEDVPSVPSKQEVKERLDEILLRVKKFFTPEVRAYQIRAVEEAALKGRVILLSPTASGKSLVIYLITQFFKDRTFLITVPTKNLVSQLKADFLSYGCDVNEIHTIMGGSEKTLYDARITISTWQSVYKQPCNWFLRFDAFIGDECHGCVAKSLTNIMENLTHCPIRIGTSGTLDEPKCHLWILEGLFGPVTRVETTDSLMKQGHVAQLSVRTIVLEYSDTERRMMHGASYMDELDFLVKHESRRNFICNLALVLKGNTIILFSRVEHHGIPMYEILKKITDRPVYMIFGGTEVEQREKIRGILETETNAILLGSIGCVATGTNIKNLHNAIMASPTKSHIRLLQSIGRILRLADGKTQATWFDIADDLTCDKWVNHTFRHYFKRLSIYKQENFPYTTKKHKLVTK